MPAETSSTTDVVMPQLGVSVAEGTIVRWLVAPGDEVRADDPLCEVDTDKIVTDIPSPAGGVVTEIPARAGATVEVGTVLARIAGAGGALVADPPGDEPAWHSPVVQRLAREHGVDLTRVTGTGRDGRVRKQDVLAAAGAATDRPLHSESPYRSEPATDGEEGGLSRMRRRIGAHMKRSLDTAATCTTWMEADMSRVEAARTGAKASELLGVTALPIVAHAAIDALREHPALNATLEGERYTRHAAVHLGVAVSLGDAGLIVPVIRDAHALTVEQLDRAIRDLARRARRGRLQPGETAGGTFTVTNPGQFGSIMATPVINQPQVAILDLEAIVKRPIVVQDDDGNDVIEIRPQTILGLSWDHRALDGAQAAQFLGALRRRLERWGG
jgi:pyruvate/2-oxoglutarate dehydrogenase complex dihydrolipoamide acyltransferase (E2) component